MNLNLTGQTVAVFGAARGIGAAITQAFTQEGAVVHGFDRSGDPEAQFSGASLALGDVTVFDQVLGFADTLGTVDHV
ncbi:MAG: oxidoreductase, partial [Chthoniobacterales bacterium]|nr:oxidoreductase [Chthoniobacterales bacterium]